jgi:site-specific DNA-methyltransferase (adenine-specific)
MGRPLSAAEIEEAVSRRLGGVPGSSVRSYLNLNSPEIFEKPGRGLYVLRNGNGSPQTYKPKSFKPTFRFGSSTLYHADCFEWLKSVEPRSIQAVVTDPPYGILEYSEKEHGKLRSGRGGVWRIPPSFDGHARSPLPRFTVLKRQDISYLKRFFELLGTLLYRVTVPGANVVIASNPILFHHVVSSMENVGFEPRGAVIRLVMTMRGGDRPKNAHQDYPNVSVMPRSMWEPWVLLRRPLDGRVQDNLRKWRTGGFLRVSESKPFGDVIESRPTGQRERGIARHPSLKPQSFLREIIRASLPLRKGTVLDPFAGSGSTLAAANWAGYQAIGIEKDSAYVEMAKDAIPKLSVL